MLSSDAVKTRARDLGFDVCGVAPAGALPELAFLREWVDHGYAGGMSYLSRTMTRRSDVRQVLPSARSVVSLGTVYNTDQPYSTERDDPLEAGIARYAWGLDYHDVVGTRTRGLLEWMREVHPAPFEARAYVDTGPVQERVYAQHAGVGWIGKNTCLINPSLGSWLFLSEIVCSVSLEPDPPALDQCGTCALCLEACPTGAIVEPWVLDATRCLSYLTIEVKQVIPEDRRADLGAHVYGCDICQDVCPWNAEAVSSADESWQPQPGLDRPRLTELWRRPDRVLRPVVDRGPMSYTGLRNLRRNTAVALGNSGHVDARTTLAEPSGDEREDPVVEEHRAWARRRLERV